MSSLTDLRNTLDEHAGSVSDAEATVRLAAVHHRVADVRRRRRVVGTAAVACTLVAGVAAVVIPRASNAMPAAPVVLGQKAPTTMSSLGYTYRTDGHGYSFSSSGSLDVASSDEPQLFSWTTSSASRVTVTTPDHEQWHSPLSGFQDYVVVPPGVSGHLQVSVDRGSVGVASYELTDAVPDGAYSKDGITFRPEFTGAPLLGATVSDRGQTEATTSFEVPRGPVSIHLVCSGLPKGSYVHVLLDGKESTIAERNSCDDPQAFDPASGSYGTQHVGRPGRTRTVQVLVTDGFHDKVALPAGSAPDLRMGVALYGPMRSVRTDAGRVARVVENGGHTWIFSGTSSGTVGDRRHDLAAAPVDRVAEVALHTRRTTDVDFRAGSWRATEGSGGGGVLGGFYAPADARVEVSVTGGPGRYAVAFYRRTD